MYKLTGKVALVTGAARGIGKTTAMKLAEMGAAVAVNDLADSRELAETISEMQGSGGQVMAVPGDVSDTAAVKAAVKSVTAKFGKIDILINNAGIVGSNNILMRTGEPDWDKIIAVNLRSAYLCSKYFLRNFSSESGRIVNISSVAGTTGLGMVDYSTSKGALIAFTRSLAKEVGCMNVTVNAIAPGATDTPLNLKAYTPEVRHTYNSRIALGRIATSEEIADPIVFLASDAARYITGHELVADGGLVLNGTVGHALS